jgi:hypothetical protein
MYHRSERAVTSHLNIRSSQRLIAPSAPIREDPVPTRDRPVRGSENRLVNLNRHFHSDDIPLEKPRVIWDEKLYPLGRLLPRGRQSEVGIPARHVVQSPTSGDSSALSVRSSSNYYTLLDMDFTPCPIGHLLIAAGSNLTQVPTKRITRSQSTYKSRTARRSS